MLLKNVQVVQRQILVMTVLKFMFLPERWGNVLSLTNKDCSPERKNQDKVYMFSRTQIQCNNLMPCIKLLHWICAVFGRTCKHCHQLAQQDGIHRLYKEKIMVCWQLNIRSAAVEESFNSTIRNLFMKTFFTLFIINYYYGIAHMARIRNTFEVSVWNRKERNHK